MPSRTVKGRMASEARRRSVALLRIIVMSCWSSFHVKKDDDDGVVSSCCCCCCWCVAETTLVCFFSSCACIVAISFCRSIANCCKRSCGVARSTSLLLNVVRGNQQGSVDDDDDKDDDDENLDDTAVFECPRNVVDCVGQMKK